MRNDFRLLQPRAHRVRGILVAVLMATILAPTALAAHTKLARSAPADSASLSAVPGGIRLVFSGAIELAVTRIRLVGPDGQAVPLGPVVHPGDTTRIVTAAVAGLPAAGTYTVVWQAAAADGHPLRGQFVFTVEDGAAGLPVEAVPAVDATPAATVAPASMPEEVRFGAGSPLYAAVRWLGFGGLLGVIGSVAFRSVVLVLLRRRKVQPTALADDAARRAARVGIAAALLLLSATALRLYAQWAALGGGTPEPSRVWALLTGTVWGRGWLVQAVATIVALFAFGQARRSRTAGWALAGVAAIALSFTPALSGHAVAHEHWPLLAVLADGVHVLGAGGWLGTLFVVLAAGLPAVRRLPDEERSAGAQALVGAFSPAALCFAGAVVVSGLVSTGLNLGTASALWTTPYGRTLLLKLAVLSAVFVTGAWNWLRVRPALGSAGATSRLRRSSSFELAVGLLVLAVTAVLVATPPPREQAVEASTAGAAQESAALRHTRGS